MTQPEMQRIAGAIEHAVAGLSGEQLSWSPVGKWSAAGVLEHLSITYGSTARLMQTIAANGAAPAGRPSARQRLFTFIVTGIGYFPSGRQAPEFTIPTGLAPDAVLETTRANLEQLDAALTALAQKFGEHQLVADHPVLGPLTLRQWRRFHWVHTRHHMKQIARLRRQQSA